MHDTLMMLTTMTLWRSTIIVQYYAYDTYWSISV